MIKLYRHFEAKYPRLFEIGKFLIVGGLATVIDFLAMAICIYFCAMKIFDYDFLAVLFKSDQYTLSWYIPVLGTAIGFLFGLIFNYLLSIWFVFNETAFAKTTSGMVLFVVFATIGFLIHVVGMYVGDELLSINYWIVKILLTLGVLVFNFVTRKLFIFRAPTPVEPN